MAKMTVAKISIDKDGLHHLVGLSSDTKTSASTVPVGSTFYESDTDQIYKVGAASTWVLHQTDLKHIAGEEQANSEFNSVTRVTPDAKIFRYAFGDGDVTVFNGPCRLYGIYVNIAFTTGGITLDDGASNALLDLPTGVLLIGTNLKFPGLRFETSLTLDHDFGGTTNAGECFIFYREAAFS